MSVVVVYSRQSLEYHAIQPRSAQHILTADAACAQGMWSVNALLLTCCTGQYWRKEPYGQNYNLCTDPFNAIGLDSLKQSKNCNYDCTSIQYAVDTVSFISQRCQHLWYQHLWLQAREQVLLLEVWQRVLSLQTRDIKSVKVIIWHKLRLLQQHNKPVGHRANVTEQHHECIGKAVTCFTSIY